ncbi:dipeptide/oligopeptide/nickel ABC transporter ATP-binding protein [Virgibacillus indicus]|uniref:Dipeptide/oligopeptide/nickel ABC transporter ATP-binding protein n=1 Tax=Virgibacillus indicus TaxID=2024554 RepID=A0A265N5Q4_9BACI|nr:oligopeptide/dipeptide ABC transporter ATP-binding protein [Virgibacillus indicus]OZU87175.1 dipeptide/oligopeptide/nickel ABC transporter ATP-binding protein [Virgibacillus indicus]
MTQSTLIEVKGLTKKFPLGKKWFKPNGYVRAVDGLDFTIKKGETFGLVGESGCGKSTTGRLINGLIEANEGEILFDGQNLVGLPDSQWNSYRKRMQMIFQDPFASLSPRMKIKDIVIEPLDVHYPKMPKSEKLEKAEKLLEICGISKFHWNKYPHEFSGGQRQRISIARSLILNPELIIADEAVSALDVSIQSQVLNLLVDLQVEFDLTYLFISHDLSVVEHISNRIGVMYLGDLVEVASKEQLFKNPKHPYTQSLLSSIPQPGKQDREKIILKGEIPSASNPPKGCKFHTRCPFAMDICRKEIPENIHVDDDHVVACHLYS